MSKGYADGPANGPSKIFGLVNTNATGPRRASSMSSPTLEGFRSDFAYENDVNIDTVCHDLSDSRVYEGTYMTSGINPPFRLLRESASQILSGQYTDTTCDPSMILDDPDVQDDIADAVDEFMEHHGRKAYRLIAESDHPSKILANADDSMDPITAPEVFQAVKSRTIEHMSRFPARVQTMSDLHTLSKMDDGYATSENATLRFATFIRANSSPMRKRVEQIQIQAGRRAASMTLAHTSGASEEEMKEQYRRDYDKCIAQTIDEMSERQMFTLSESLLPNDPDEAERNGRIVLNERVGDHTIAQLSDAAMRKDATRVMRNCIWYGNLLASQGARQ